METSFEESIIPFVLVNGIFTILETTNRDARIKILEKYPKNSVFPF